MGKTRDLFKKIRDTKGTFHAKMGSTGTTEARVPGVRASQQEKPPQWEAPCNTIRESLTDAGAVLVPPGSTTEMGWGQKMRPRGGGDESLV